MSATCIMNNCRRKCPDDEPFCSVHRDKTVDWKARSESLQAQRDEARADAQALDALKNDDWFVDVADFLDQYQDAEIIDGTTHPNKAMRLLAKLQELGL